MDNGLLNTRATETRVEREAAENYRREQEREQQQVFIEPLKQEIDGLQNFLAAVANYYFIASSDAPDKQAVLDAKAELLNVSGVAYRYENILRPLAEFHYQDGSDRHQFSFIRQETTQVLTEKRVELTELLDASKSQLSETKQEAGPSADDGLLVNAARRVQKLTRRKWLP